MEKAAALQKAATKYVAPIDQIELACRMLEAAGRIKRPQGMTAMQAFLSLDQEDQDGWLAASSAAMLYWQECIDQANQSS